MDLLGLFRLLSSFSPERTSLKGAPWDSYVDWAISNGLAPMAAYNLEYRLAGGDAPDWVRDRLLSVYQGTANDNVMKLIILKRTAAELQGRKLLLFGAANYAEALYPHVAFRAVPELRVKVGPSEVAPFTGYLKKLGYQELKAEEDWEGADVALAGENTPMLVYGRLLSGQRDAEEQGIVDRALPAKVYGSSVFRPDLEDALLITCLQQARAGFDAPFILFVDLRELILGGPSTSGVYSRPPNLELLRERAAQWRIDRAVYASLSILERLFPQTASAVEVARPKISRATRALLDKALVDPIASLGKVRVVRGMDRLRKVLAGG